MNRFFPPLYLTLDRKKLALLAVLWLLIIYLLFHFFTGSRGLIAYFHLQKELMQKNQLLTELQEQRMRLEYKVRLLHPESLDYDLLDELAHGELALIHQDEYMLQPFIQDNKM